MFALRKAPEVKAMYVFDNIGQCHNCDGIAPGWSFPAPNTADLEDIRSCANSFAKSESSRTVGTQSESTTLDLSAPEMLMLAMIAKFLEPST